jgi:hypothetical protein
MFLLIRSYAEKYFRYEFRGCGNVPQGYFQCDKIAKGHRENIF